MNTKKRTEKIKDMFELLGETRRKISATGSTDKIKEEGTKEESNTFPQKVIFKERERW